MLEENACFLVRGGFVFSGCMRGEACTRRMCVYGGLYLEHHPLKLIVFINWAAPTISCLPFVRQLQSLKSKAVLSLITRQTLPCPALDS